MAKRKKLTVAKLRKKLWSLISVYERTMAVLRQCEKDGVDFTTKICCYTCDQWISAKYECDLSHYYAKGAFEALRFDPRNYRPACKKCNLFLQGNTIEFERRLRDEIGQSELDDMHLHRHDVIKRPRYWYEEEIEKYKTLNSELPFLISDNTE